MLPKILLVVKFFEKSRTPKFGTKISRLGYFWTGIWTEYCHIWNKHPQIGLTVNFCERTRMPKFETKNFWFRYFKNRIWKKYWDIWNQHPRVCLLEKFGGKKTMPKFGGKKRLIWAFLTKNVLFGYFWSRILKILLSYLKSASSSLSIFKI